MSTSTAPYFFMSYSREDTVKQRRIVKELRERGINIWVDIENLTPGTPTWEREIEKAIRGATGIIVLLSPESNSSEWVRREISFGEQHRKRIFPVLIEGGDDTSTPLRLANHQRVDLRTKFEAGLDELAQAIKDYTNVKHEIASQSRGESSKSDSKKRDSQPAINLKKYGLPALLALVGVALIAGVVLIVQFIGNNTPATETPATPPPNIDPTAVTVTEPATDQDKPIGRIVYTCQVEGKDDYEICSINADRTGQHQITSSGFSSYYPSPSPDGNSVIYSSNETGKFQIYEWSFISKEKTLITINSLKKNDLEAPEISPDGSLIVFSNQTDTFSEIWLADRDGTNAHKLFGSKSNDAVAPTWSPDGRQILFAMGLDGDNQLYIISVEGGDPVRVPVKDPISTRGRSDWSINNTISFDQGGPFMHDVYLMNTDGSELRPVSKPGFNSQGASFSSDGKWIAFTRYTNVAGRDENSCEIFIMRVDGTDMHQLTDNEFCDFQPRWGN